MIYSRPYLPLRTIPIFDDYPLVNVYVAMERSIMLFSWENHHFSMAISNSFLLVYQAGYIFHWISPWYIMISQESQGLSTIFLMSDDYIPVGSKFSWDIMGSTCSSPTTEMSVMLMTTWLLCFCMGYMILAQLLWLYGTVALTTF